ncbi:MAG: hypothetical protein L6R42_007676, partial [Xanthoria sp. 1 TBL-2021]
MARGWAQGLDFLHGHGIIHQDIKASNLGIVLGHPPQGLIFDMDDALVAETSYDWRGGTLLYNAPEFNELRDEGADPNIDFHEELPPYDKHLDIWALGLSIWYMNDRLLIWYLHDPPEVRDRIASLPPHGQVLQNFVTKSRHAGYLKQLNNALENASAA